MREKRVPVIRIRKALAKPTLTVIKIFEIIMDYIDYRKKESSMKKYQMWLERKTYSQHLNNLIRIKLAPKEQKTPSKLSMSSQRAKNSPNQTIIKSQPSLSSNQLQYIISSR